MQCRTRRTEASTTLRCGRWVLAVTVAALGIAACASTDDGVVSAQDADPDSLNSASAPEASPEDAQASVPSTGTIHVADQTYEFMVECYELGAGDLLVLGVAEDPDSTELAELFLQAFLADPYIGLRLGDGTLLESALDGPLDIYFQDDMLRASAVRFVQGLDLDTGEAEEVGLGSLDIHCNDYSREPPA